jgi:hypothetical protein
MIKYEVTFVVCGNQLSSILRNGSHPIKLELKIESLCVAKPQALLNSSSGRPPPFNELLLSAVVYTHSRFTQVEDCE